MLPIVSATHLSFAGDAPKPHLISILQDDLGWYDSGVHNAEAAAWSGNITGLAKEGVVLKYHYSHWHCSPSRRSFLTGRLPIHHGEQLSSNAGDDVDLRMTWISEKLASAGYDCHWFGKYHTGFRSFRHLPRAHNFSHSSVGSLQTGGDYAGKGHSTRWQDDHPIWEDSQFVDRPAGCNATPITYERNATTPWYEAYDTEEETLAPMASCNASAFLPHTQLPCGQAIKFVDAASAMECCATCAATDDCTHWVFKPGEQDQLPCHVKQGGVPKSCPGDDDGSTSGIVNGPVPPPSPPGPGQCVNEYSTDLWGQLALQAVEEHDASRGPIYVHLCFQAVHTPYQQAPNDPTGNVYRGMLWRADVFVGKLVALLTNKEMYDNTLLLYSSDNGGVEAGNNYPLRGEKHSNWEGGMRVTAFLGGGFVPQGVRGTANNHTMHLVDWFATFAALAGASTTDDPPVAPAPADPTRPYDNIYGERSFPPLDGTNVWPMIVEPDAHPIDAAHPYLALSKEVLIAGRYKLLVSQPFFKTQESGWKQPDGKWRAPDASETFACMKQDASPATSFFPTPGEAGGSPCLFDLRADPGEHVDLAGQFPGVVAHLWAVLNQTLGGARDCNGWSYKGVANASIPGPRQPDGTTSCSPPELLGNCNAKCANAKWQAFGKADGPICGVPGCG